MTGHGDATSGEDEATADSLVAALTGAGSYVVVRRDLRLRVTGDRPECTARRFVESPPSQ